MKILLAALLALIHSSFMQAEVAVRGYGTVGYSVITKKDVKDEAEDFDYFGEVGYQGTINRDTRFGLNISSEIGENMEAITQFGGSFGSLFHGYSLTNRMDLQAELLLIRYQFSDNLQFRIGLQQAPIWLISEERNISYTYPWARPPNEIYSAADADDMRGISAIYNLEFDEVSLKNTVVVGELGYEKIPYGRNLIVSAEHFNGVIFASEATVFDNTTIRGIYGVAGEYTVSYDTNQTIVAKRDTGEEGQFVVSELATVDLNRMEFASGGFRSEIDDLFLMGEVAERRLDFGEGTGTRGQAVSNGKLIVNGWYLTLGYNIGDFRLKVTYAAHKTRLQKSRLQSSLSESIPVAELKEVAEYQGAVAAQNVANRDQETLYVGFDYSWSPILIQKFEMEQIKTGEEFGGLSELPKGTELQVFTTTLAYVF